MLEYYATSKTIETIHLCVRNRPDLIFVEFLYHLLNVHSFGTWQGQKGISVPLQVRLFSVPHSHRPELSYKVIIGIRIISLFVLFVKLA